MLEGKQILAVVPARSGSKGVPNKNMYNLLGVSLIGWAGRTLAQLEFVDRRIISTDSSEYAREGERYGLEAPFLRPSHLSSDVATAVETMQHALTTMEAIAGQQFDIVLIIEPTCPLRLPSDIETSVRQLITLGADSAVTVSPLPDKAHPLKALKIANGCLGFYLEAGRKVTGRQSLESLYWRNGACYALTRSCLLEQAAIFGQQCVPVIIDRQLVNIDEAWELEWAEYLLKKQGFEQTITPLTMK